MKPTPNNISIGDFVKNGANFKEGFSNFTATPGMEVKMPPYKRGFSNFVADSGAVAGQQTLFAAGDETSGVTITQMVPVSAAQKLRWGIGAMGSVAGILLAVHRKSGFWGGVGWWIVGGMAGGAIGWIATSGMKEEEKK